MPLTRPIPDEAIPLVAFLCRGTKRPRGLPKSLRHDDLLRTHRTPGNTLRWMREGETVCPLGFHPLGQEKPDPDHPGAVDQLLNAAFPERIDGDHHKIDPAQAASDAAFHAFIEWWDEQTDAKAAVEAVWAE